MIASPRALDCAPLTTGAEARLTNSQLRRIEPLQRVLLRPLDYAEVDDWRRAVNRALVRAFDSDAAMFQLDLEGVPLHLSDEFDTAALNAYAEQVMPTMDREIGYYRRVIKLRAGNRSIAWDSDLDWLYGSEYFNELVVPTRAFDPLWAAAPCGSGEYPAVIHTYHDRRRSRHFFDASDVALMRVVQPALEAGTATVVRLHRSRSSLAATLDGLREGALVYEIGGDLLHRNSAVDSLARTARARAALVQAGLKMATAFAAGVTADPRSRAVTRTIQAAGRQYRLRAVLLAEGTFALTPAALVTIAPGEAPLPDRDTIRERFGLTRRQADVALLLAERKTNPELAELLCISEHTVRSHVEAVMGKLGVRDRRAIADQLRERTSELDRP